VSKKRLTGIGGRRCVALSSGLLTLAITAISVFHATPSHAAPVVTRSTIEVSAPNEIGYISCRRGWFAVDLETVLDSRPRLRLRRSERSDFGPHFARFGVSIWIQPLSERRDYLIYNVGRRHVRVRLFCEKGR
jgi:hypothetical protein